MHVRRRQTKACAVVFLSSRGVINMKTSRRDGFVALMLLAGLTVTPSYADIVVYDSDGFEMPKFTAGNLEGQDGWVRTGNASGGVVEIAVVESGFQAVQITRAPNEDCAVGRTHDWFPKLGAGPDLYSMGHERFAFWHPLR